MTSATIEQIELAMDFGSVEAWRVVKGTTWDTPFGVAAVQEYEGRCDHETCYETHDTRLVFSLGGRYFLKTGTYDSQDGFQWSGPLREVRPTQKTVVDYDLVPAVVWDEAGISTFLRRWFEDQPSSRYSSYDWTNLFYAAQKAPFQPAGFPYLIKGVEQYQPGEEDCNGPVWLIFEINGEQYAAKGRNVSHVGWDFDGVYTLEKVEKKTVTMEVWT